ncbi:MAG: hypothetical protein ACI82H_002220, partial [Alphaproteobacteria bacterium]
MPVPNCTLHNQRGKLMKSYRTQLLSGTVIPLAMIAGVGLGVVIIQTAAPARAAPVSTMSQVANPTALPAPVVRVACNPCAAKKAACNPCAVKKEACNPCAVKKAACNPCAAKNPCGAANRCGPCGASAGAVTGCVIPRL